MSYSSGFFDAVDLGEGHYDRVYSSAEFAHYFGLFVGNGVFPSPSTGLSVVCNTPEDMTVKVSPGSGFINGHYLTVPEGGNEYLAVPIAHPSLPRIDSIVMGLDLGERRVSLYVKPGQAAASPQPVTLQRDNALYELELARIFVVAGAGSITQTAITDMRTNPESCGLVTGLIDQFDVSGFFQAAYASFEEWFEEIRGQISEDLGASLQLQVNELREQAEQDRENALSEEAKEVLGLPEEATPSDAFLMLYKSSGGAVRRNRPPLDTDAEEVGKLWVVPKMVFNNLMPNALSQSISNWATSTASLSVSGSAITAVGNASDTRTQIQAPLSPVSVGDKVFIQSFVTVNHDANEILAELIIGTTVVEEKTLQFPTAGSTMTFQAVVPAGLEGNLSLRFYSLYNTAAVQSGKGFTVRDITVWNLTEDMCEAQEGNEFAEQEAANYISSFGQFQSKEYEYSTCWWVLHGVTNGSYLWHRMYDYATTEEAQAGTDDTKLMSALKTQQFLTARRATDQDVATGTKDRWVAANQLKASNDYMHAYVDLRVYVIRFVQPNGTPVEGCVVSSEVYGSSYVSDAEGYVRVPYNIHIFNGYDSLSIVPVLNCTISESVLEVDAKFGPLTHTITVTPGTLSAAVSAASGSLYCVPKSLYPNGAKIWLCGGGGSGALLACKAEDYFNRVGTGGAGGYTAYKLFTAAELHGVVLSAVVGAGGAALSGSYYNQNATTNGNAGGTSSVSDVVSGRTLLSAAGGSGGLSAQAPARNGASGTVGAEGGSGSGAVAVSNASTAVGIGAGGSDGSDGGGVTGYAGGKGQGTTTRQFNESAGTLCCGAGGSIYCCNNISKAGTAGSGGGTVGKTGSNSNVSVAAATVPGAGTGAAGVWNNGSAYQASVGKAGDGVVLIKAA